MLTHAALVLHPDLLKHASGGGIISVLSATSRAPARRWISGASARVNRRRIRRGVAITRRLYGAARCDQEVANAMPHLARCGDDAIPIRGIDQRSKRAIGIP